MATTVRTAASSTLGTGLVDSDATLYVMEGGFYAGIDKPIVLSGNSRSTIAGLVESNGSNSDSVAYSTTGSFDHLTVTSSGHITGRTAVLFGDGSAQVTNNGTISGSFIGIMGATGGTEIENFGTISSGHSSAVEFTGTSSNVLLNAGKIGGSVSGNLATVTNTGIILGGLSFALATTVNNFGTITGGLWGGSGDDDLANYGTLAGSLNLRDGTNSVLNHSSGIIGGTTEAGIGVNSVTNHGTIRGSILLAASAKQFGDDTSSTVNAMTNSGTVLGGYGGADGEDSLLNSGRIAGNVDLANGDNYLTNTGLINGSLKTGTGIDFIDSTGGMIKGTVDLEAGRDRFVGGDHREIVIGGLGDDTIDLDGGHDTYRASAGRDGNDTVEGGDGLDTYDALAATAAVAIDLEGETAKGSSIGIDEITGFENAIGSNLKDFLSGDDAANLLDGNGGDDTIIGKSGNDKIRGGAGADTIAGGWGRDQLTGGDGADKFVFYTIADSTVAAAGRDVIFDFTAGTDKLDLAVIDASRARTGDQAFTFIGSGTFSGAAGELRASVVNGYTVVTGDVNGDKLGDFAISLKGALTLKAVDFVL